MRKTFSCGHSGKGLYCHRCDIKQKEIAQHVIQKTLKMEHIASVENVLEIRCDSLPIPIIEKAAAIVKSIRSGISFSFYKGKRLTYRNRDAVSIPVGYSHRLIGRKEADDFKVIYLGSHEEYNRVFKTV